MEAVKNGKHNQRNNNKDMTSGRRRAIWFLTPEVNYIECNWCKKKQQQQCTEGIFWAIVLLLKPQFGIPLLLSWKSIVPIINRCVELRVPWTSRRNSLCFRLIDIKCWWVRTMFGFVIEWISRFCPRWSCSPKTDFNGPFIPQHQSSKSFYPHHFTSNHTIIFETSSLYY